MTAAEASVLDRTVNQISYPLDDPTSRALTEARRRARAQLATTGCCVLRDFVHPETVAALARQCASVAPNGYYQVVTVNAYNTAPDARLPDDHPAHITMRRGNAFVARDLIPAHFVIARLYLSKPFQDFVAACFGVRALYPLADELAGLCVNVLRPGTEHPWHFDTNELTVSMVTQQPDAGGDFEYCPGIRSADDEDLVGVREVLAGRAADRVRRLPLRAGDLQLFKGRYALHRVSTVKGVVDRHSAIFAYSEQPGVVGSLARTRQLFGRALPQHRAAAGRPDRLDGLLD